MNLDAQVKVSYDTQSTRCTRRLVVSSSDRLFYRLHRLLKPVKSALIDGVEWNVRLSEVGSPDVLEKFDATFESYWASTEYEEYVPTRDALRFDRAVAPMRQDSLDAPLLLLGSGATTTSVGDSGKARRGA